MMFERAKTLLIAMLLITVAGNLFVDFSQTAAAAPQANQLKAPAHRNDGSVRESESVSARPAPAAPSDFVIGESDVLNINVWKENEISQSVVVRPDGKITLPLIGEVTVSGLTPLQAQALLTNRLESILTNPQVTVTVTEIRSRMATITGEVLKPGAYPLLAPTTVLQLIANAGGLGQFANKKGIFLLRSVDGKQQRFSFNYSEVIKGKKPEQNILVRPGDTVVVP